MTSTLARFVSRAAVGLSTLAIATLLVGVSIGAAKPTFRIEESPCPPFPFEGLEKATCWRLTVPENRRQPNGRTISLSVAVIPSTSANPRPDPILWIAGGPGDDALTEISLALKGKLNEHRHVIFMSQRGTLTAQPSLTCREVDLVGAETLDKPYNSPDVGLAFAKATAECRRRVEATGADLTAYNTLESSDDLEDLRLALGIPQWNVYGISYGTDHALTYMRMHPRGIRSVGIDGVFAPPIAGGVSAWTAAGEGLNAIFRACDAQPECRERYGDIGATFRALVQQYEANPQTVTVTVGGKPVDVTISGGMLLQWTVSPGTHTAAVVPMAIDALAHGDPTFIATSWAGGRLDPAGIGLLSNGLFYGVSCGEWVPYESEESVVAAGQRAFPTFPRAIHLNAPNLPFMRANCDVWNVPPIDPAIRDVTESRIPTLVISAQYDGQTPASSGPLVARTLPNSTVVEIPNVAHVAFASPSPEANECTQAIVRDFFEVLNAVDTSCAARVPPTKFVIAPRAAGSLSEGRSGDTFRGR
jgi:pimeloyl-ACP methyl ester carboxylesterase